MKRAPLLSQQINHLSNGMIFFADNILSSAILDRVGHHSIIFRINGPSYRAKIFKNKYPLFNEN